MTRIEVLRPFVEKTVAEYLGMEEDKLQTNEDGTIPIRAGTAVVNVRLVEGGHGHPVLQVYAALLHGIQKSAGLLEKLNEVNAGLTFARAFWLEEQVILTIELRAESLDAEQVAQAVSVVSLAADLWDGALKQEFGGETSFPDEPAQQAPSGPQPAEGAPPVPGGAAGADSPHKPAAEDPPSAGYI